MQTTEDIVTTTDTTTDEFDRDSLISAEARRRKFRAHIVKTQKGEKRRLKAFLLDRRTHYRNTDSDARKKHLQDIDMMIRYYNGDQYGDYVDGAYTPYTLQDGDFAYTIPVINGHVDQAFMQLMRTNIEYEFAPVNEYEHDARTLAGMCEQLAVEEKNRLMTEDAQADEIMNSILAGESYRCLVWGINPDNPKKAVRVRHKREVIQIPGRRECAACKSEVGSEEACPNCGATYIEEIPGATALKITEDGTHEIPLAENILHIPHPMSVQRDLSSQKLKYSTFIVERDYLPRHVAEWMYQTKIETGDAAHSEEVRLRREQERSSMQVDAITGSGRDNGIGQGSTVEREHIWMDASEYGHFYCDEVETLPDGSKLPAGTLLGERYPNGLYVCILGNTVVRFKPVNRNRQWSVVLYGKRPGSGRGAGLQSLIPLQDIINDDFNQSYAIRMTSARPLTVVNRQAIKELPEAGQFLFIDKLPTGANSMNGAVAQYPGQTVPNDGTSERIEAAMQWIGGTASLMGAAGGADQRAMGTATGIAAAQENAAGRMIGPIKQRIAADKEFMFQILENIKDYSAPEQRKELEKRFGPDAVSCFFKCNFRQQLRIMVSQNTDMPRSMALTQANMMAFGNVAAGLANVPWGAELLSTMADTLGITFNVGQGRNDRKEAEYRLNKLAAIEARLAQKNPAFLSDTQGAAEFMFTKLSEFCAPLIELVRDDEGDEPFNPAGLFLQDHVAFMDVYKDWLFGNESKTASDAMRLTVIQLFMEHFKAQAATEFEAAQLQKELTESVQPAPTPEEQEAALQGQLEGQALTERKQLEAKAIDYEASEEAKDAELERRLIAQEHEAELRARPQA